MASQYDYSDSEATTSEAPSAFLNEDDSILSESVDMLDSARSARSLNSEYSVEQGSSMQRLVDGLQDVDNKFGSFIQGQTTRISSANSQATEQSNDVKSLQDELNGARLASPSNSIFVETVDEESCHQFGLVNASLRRLPSAGASSLGHIQEEYGGDDDIVDSSASNHIFDESLSKHKENTIQQSHRTQGSEPTVVETVDEASCHESGIFSSDRRRRASNASSYVSEDDSSHPPQEEFDPSYFKKRETQPPTPTHDELMEDAETTDTSGGFSNANGMGAQWDNLESTLDQQTNEVRSSPYYNTAQGQEAPFSPTGNENTEDLRRELDSAALAPPVTATHSFENRDVEAAPNNNTEGTYWQGDKTYDENYDDELLDVSLSTAGANGNNTGSNNGGKNNPTQTSNALKNFVNDETKYKLVVKSLAGCICCMILWTLIMIIVLATK